MTGDTASDTAKPARKRQARGEKRMHELLDAAAEVFATHGYAKASTNAIAAAAGASPGTLYQFFRGKQEIAEALMARYVARLDAAHGAAFVVDGAALPLADLLDRVLDPIIAFDRANPGFHTLLADPGITPELAQAKRPAQDLIFQRLDGIFADRAPHLPADERRLTAAVAIHMFRGLLPMIMAASERELPTVTREAKQALHAYLAVALKES
ncbi:TetR/AcrR family transcriptional regulator [Glycomyces artemisiae]|uniref:TetR family transcriptional regulator n=1 Tax=Glycomyces artemisiae TaxID=1076443 RepID=A0A2T0UQ30_9ACTN|nr:TetR/AcrR family transcriptional regulator [Glycomyces artemisiae]PRY60030.1 TetR family transcriptional regulator [Glycomyces artemisiae]